MSPLILRCGIGSASADILFPEPPERGEVAADLPPPALPPHESLWTDPQTAASGAILLLLVMGAIVGVRMRRKRTEG